jgi:hypothetical protein
VGEGERMRDGVGRDAAGEVNKIAESPTNGPHMS